MTALTRPLPWLALAAVALLLAASSLTTADPDLWGHVRFGLDLLRSHQLSAIDPYSFTQDVPWINHEWLSELQMGVAYSVFGPAGLALLKGALATTALLLVWGALARVRFEARLGVTMLAALGTLSLARTLRPQLWSVVCLALLCRALAGDRRWRRWLPLLFAVWANLHGGWIVGLAVLVAWLGAETATGESLLRRGVLVGSCLLATFANPYGWNLWAFLSRTVHLVRPNIEEWMPIWRFGPTVWLAPVVAAAGVIWIVTRPFPARRPALLALSLLAVAGTRVARVAPYLSEAAAILLAARLAQMWPRQPFEIRTASERAFVVGATVAAVAVSIVILAHSLACIRVDRTTQPDPEAVGALRYAVTGRLVTFFNWGEYAIWHFGPGLRVSMDGRRETIYSDTRIAEHDAILDGTAAGFSTLDQWRPEYVWLPASSGATRRWLMNHGYRIDIQSAESFVAVRSDLPVLQASSTVAGSCFPD